MATTFISLLFILLGIVHLTVESSNNRDYKFVCEFNYNRSALDIYHGFNEDQVKNCLRTYRSAETLTFSRSKLKNIPDYLNILERLVNLDLSHNEIHHVEFKVLAKICKNIKKIILDFNNVQSLLPGSLDCLESLEQLYIANNNLTIIKNGTFSKKLSALTYLHLVHNGLTVLDSSWFSKVLLSDKMQICINASWNKIRAFSNSVDISIEDFSYATDMLIVLVHNNITTFNIDYYEQMFHIKNQSQLYRLWNSGFDARFNPFICDCSLLVLAKVLRIFYLMDPDNPIFFVTCGSPGSLEGMLIRKVPVDQFNCTVTVDCPESCACTKTAAINLTTVVCDDQYPLHDLPRTCPEADKISITIRSDNLTQIIATECLNNYTMLDVSQSSVTYIDPLVVENLEGRDKAKIYLHDNDLERLPRRFKTFNFSKGQILTIHGNPFNCDCNLRWMKKWLLSNTDHVHYQDKIICESGLGKGTPVVDVPDNKFLCQKNETKLTFNDTLIIAAGSLFVLVLLFTFAVYNRNTIQVFMIHHFDVCKYCCRKKAYRRLQYDLFVPHSCDDDQIVMKIVNTLERIEHPYKVCIGERNFAAGKTISENILTAIESSQTTLLVISNNFLRSAWCNMEFREAHMRFLKDRNIRMVLILLEELDTALVYKELKFYIDTHVYIKYNDRHFWAKLLQSLPVMIAMTM